MKKILGIAVCCLLIGVTTVVWMNRGQEPEVVIEPLHKETAQIACDQPTRDFGIIKAADGKVEHTFPVVNSGSAPLVLVNCDGSCGCITAEWSKQPIAPGASGFVTVTYNPDGVNGVFMKTIQVVSNATNNPLELHIRGEVQ